MVKGSPIDLNLIVDWEMYKLILFNIVQNAIKYNQFKGDLLIKINLESFQFDSKNSAVLETEVIDSGIGIEEERQDILFKPFLELKRIQDLKLVKDKNIGMGLACSLSIVQQLGGDITLKKSKRGLTIFAFKLPVETDAKKEFRNEKISSDIIDYEFVKVNIDNNRGSKQKMKQYIDVDQFCEII